MLVRLVIIMVVLFESVLSYKMFQDQIPNGAHVPYPCKDGQIWDGVGHLLSAGTGDRNPFGLDFAANNLKWTTAMCQKDSDGDGRSNGVELGDPNCTFTVGSTPAFTTGLSHPGICDPWDSPACMAKVLTSGKYKTQGDWLADMCSRGDFQCAALNESGITNMTIRLPPTPIPGKVTTYECQIFDMYQLGLPRGQDFHVVAVTPLIDNRYVLHHMVIMGCDDDTDTTPQPYECGMLASNKCQQFMNVWTVGLPGECYHPLSGVRIGQTGFKIVAIQLHWNNPAKSTDYMDSSGLVLHYTPHLRQYDAGVLMIGSTAFVLPPRKLEVYVYSTCSGSCTQSIFNGTVSVTSAWNHMHYAGRKMNVEVKRNGTFLTYLTNDQSYSYDSPEVHSYPDPVILLPGDALYSTCVFTTLDRSMSTTFGEATQDEMCLAFLTYFPKQAINDNGCTDGMNISFCNPESWNGCQFPTFLTLNGSFFMDVATNCRSYYPCVTECVETLVRYMQTEPCMKGNSWEYMQYLLSTFPQGQEVMSRILSCEAGVYKAMNPRGPGDDDNYPNSAITTTLHAAVLFLSMIALIMWQ